MGRCSRSFWVNRLWFFSISILLALSLVGETFAQTPSLTNGLPAKHFVGEQVCFDLDLTNSGDPGYGPYLRLILPGEITFDSATFLNSGVTSTAVGTFSGPGQLTDPRSGDIVSGDEGDTFTLLVYPLGSVVTGGPTLTINTCATISTSATVGVGLDVTAQPVYEYGDTATGDNGRIQGTPQAKTLTPTLIEMNVENDSPEGENPPGASFETTYTTTVDVANAQTVFDLVITDVLDAGTQFVGPVSITGGTGCVESTTPSTISPGGTLEISCTLVSGTTSASDLAISYPTYIIDILDESNCGTQTITNNVSLEIEFPDNTPQATINDTSDIASEHLVVRQGASPATAVPGDTITISLSFAITDYDSTTSLVITDILPDGYTFGSHQSMNISGSGAVVIVPTVTAQGGGGVSVEYDVSAATGTLAAGTTGTIIYTATLDQAYVATTSPLLAYDDLTTSTTGTYDLNWGASGCNDDSSTTVGIMPVTISKEIVNVQTEYFPGDTITFRLSMTIPSGDSSAIVFEDYFPLPVLDATTIDTTFGNDITLSSTDTLSMTPTAITIDAATNSLRIEWPDVSTASSQTLSVNVAIYVENDPMNDNLFLTNLFQAESETTPGAQKIGTSPVSFSTRAPELVITKGISASDNPTADATISPSPALLPVDGAITASDGGDTVTYTITVENIGGAPADNVVVTDPAVTELTGAAIVSVLDGDGTPLGSSGTLASGLALDNPLDANDGAQGAPYSTDTAIITVAYTLAALVEPEQLITNTASAAWTSSGGAVSFPAVTDDANVTIASPTISSTVTTINPGYTGNLVQASIGEEITFQAIITVPEGVSSNFTFTDLLDTGLAFTEVVSVVNSSGDLVTSIGTFADVRSGAVFASSGGGSHQYDGLLTLDFGTLTNTNTVDGTAETITITYLARVINWTENTRETSLNNLATIRWDNPNGGGQLSEDNSAGNVTVVEPTLQVVTTYSAATGDAGDTITIVTDISHTVSSDADAFDVSLENIIPPGFTFAGSISSAGVAPNTGPSHGAGVVTASWDSLSVEQTSQIKFDVTIDTDVNPTEIIQATFSLEWESLLSADEGALGIPMSNTLAVERTGNTADTGGSMNNYKDQASDSLQVSDASMSVSIDSVSPGGASSDIAPGDTITYLATVILPEGTTPGLTLSSVLPPGVSFQSASVDDTAFLGTAIIASKIGDGAVSTGETVTITFNASTIVTGDNNGGNNSFGVNIVGLVEGSEVVNDGFPTAQSKTSYVTLDYTGNTGTIQDDASIDFAEPELSITTSLSPDTSLDAGDTVTITMTVDNYGTSKAYDVTPTMVLNNNGEYLFDTGSAQEISTPAGFTYNFADPNVSYTGGTIAAGAKAVFTFTAIVGSTVLCDSSFKVIGSVSGDSQSGVVTGERSTSDTEYDYGYTSKPTMSLALSSTSESWTSGTEVAIGEVLTFTITATIPEGMTQESGFEKILSDTMPMGHTYITGTATIRAIFDTSITGSTIGVLPSSTTAITPVVNGQDLEFDLGDITNNDSDGNVEQVILTYQLLVDNTSNNNRTNVKNSIARLSYNDSDGSPQNTSGSVSLTVAEPNLSVTNGALPATVTGGSTVTFTVVATNTSGTNVTRAWEPIITDALPARYNAPFVITSATHSRAGVLSSVCASFTGNTMSCDLSCLAASEQYIGPGESITVSYTADVDPSISFEEQIDSTATLRATSLPGANGTGSATPGVSGDSDGERDSSGGENDLIVSDDATVTASKPTLTKSAAISNLAILETTTMTIEVDISVGTTNNFVITEDLASGLSYTGSAISINMPGSNFTSSLSPSTTPGAGTDPLVFDFGTVTNSAMAAQTIFISYEVAPDNILANQNGTTLTNTVELTYQNASQPFPNFSATITVVEPNLEVAKTITAGASGSDAGDTISYQVAVQNTAATATAYRVNLTDILPAKLLGATNGTGNSSPFFTSITVDDDGGQVIQNGGGALTAGDAVISTTTNTDDTLGWPLLQIPAGATLTITYNAILHNDISAGDTLTSTVTANYNSLLAGGGRDSGDTSEDDNDANLDNYGESKNVTLTVDSTIAISAALDSAHATNDFNIGDLITYALRVDLIEGITGNVTVTSVLPSGLTYEGPVRVVAGANISYSGAGTAAQAPTGTLSIAMGDITNTSDGNGTNDFLLIEVDARVNDIGDNTDGTLLTTTVSLASDVGSAGPDTQDIDIIEPNLTVTPTVSTAVPSLGDTVTYTVTVAHSSSTGDAYDVILTDVIPAGLTYVPGSHAGDGSVNEADPSSPDFSLGTITLADGSKAFTFNCTVDLDVTVNTAITTTLSGTYDSQSGTPSVERSYNTSGSVDITPATTFIDATQTVAIQIDGGTADVADPGDTLTYTATLNNTGAAVNNAVFTVRIPTHGTYVPSSLTTDTGSVNDTGVPNLSVALGTLSGGASATITYQVTVDGGTATGSVLSAQGTVDSDQSVAEPTDADGVDENGDQPTRITVGGTPDISETLHFEKLVKWTNDGDTSDDITAGDTLSYLLTLSNRGNQTLTGVSFSDTIPAGLTYVGASATSSNGTITIVGDAVSGAIDSLAPNQTVTASFNVTIDVFIPTNTTFTNQALADSDQTDQVLSDSDGSTGDVSTITTIAAVNGVSGAPVVDAQERGALVIDEDDDGFVDPGDTLELTVITTNIGASNATNVRLAHTIPTSTTVVAGSVISSSGVVVTESPVSVNIGDLAPGALVTVTFRVTVDGGTADGTIILAQASVTADGSINELSDDNGDDADGLNPALIPVDTGEGSGAGSPGMLLVIEQSSSEAVSPPSTAIIGELLTLRVSFAPPAGITNENDFSVTLPAGMSYVASSARLARTFDTGLNSSTDPGSINSTATGTFVGLTDGTDLTSGQIVTLPLGTVINSDNDVGDETYTLEIQARIDNVAENQGGTLLTISGGLSYFDGLSQVQNLPPATLDIMTVDTLAPVIAGVVIPNTAMKVDDVVTVTITVADDGGDTYTNVFGTIGGFSVDSLSRSDSTTYTASFTVTEGGNNVDTGSTIPVSFTLDDGAGNTSNAYTTAINQNADSIDANSPIIMSVDVPANGTHILAGNLDFTVNVSEVVTVSNTPRLALDIGGTTKHATYVSGSGSMALFFRYTIESGLMDTNGISLTGTIDLNSTGTIFDAAGNDVNTTLNGSGVTTFVNVDAIAPTTTISVIALSADTGSSASDFITKTASQIITATLSTGLFAGEILYGSVDSGSTYSDVSSKVSGTAVSWDGVTLSGTSSVKFKVTDEAGNDGTVASQSYTLDTTVPSSPSVPDMASWADSGSSNSDNITVLTEPTFTGTAEANSTFTLSSSLDGVVGTATVDGSGDWSIASSTLTEWFHDITAFVIDVAGNVSVVSSSLFVTIDTTEPVFSGVPSHISEETYDSADTTKVVSWTEPTATDNFDSSVTPVQTEGLVSGSDFPIGITTITYEVTDLAGNLATASFTVAVRQGFPWVLFFPAIAAPHAVIR